MGFMEKAAATLATKYGVVTQGQYQGCQMALGNPPDKKVATSTSFTQVIFVDGNEEKGRYDILKLRMSVVGHNDKGVQMAVRFTDGKTSQFDLLLKQEDKLLVKILKTFFGQKGGLNDNAQDQKNLKFHNMVVFFNNTALCMGPADVDFFEGFFMDNDVLDDLTKKLIGLHRAKFPKNG